MYIFTSIGNKGKSFIFLFAAFGYGTFICSLLDAHDTFLNVSRPRHYLFAVEINAVGSEFNCLKLPKIMGRIFFKHLEQSYRATP